MPLFGGDLHLGLQIKGYSVIHGLQSTDMLTEILKYISGGGGTDTL